MMTLQEIAVLMMEDGRYFVERYAEIPKLVQAKTHKRWRVNKKWAKRFGFKTVYETKRVKAMDVTVENVIEFCYEKQFPLPDELLNTIQND